MPELPEVEATALFLRERVVGKLITAVTVLWDRTIAQPGRKDFCKIVPGSRIRDVRRRGKYVVIEIMDSEGAAYSIFGHMRMSGSFDVISSSHAHAKHDRVILGMDNDRDIRFHDPRKFGRFFLTTDPSTLASKIGVEPLSREFTPEVLAQILSSRKGAIKPLLLNQGVIAGLGNIYVDESLWSAKIHPLTKSYKVSKIKIHALHKAIQKILLNAIEMAGTDFGDGVVEGGGYNPKVYARDGRPCQRCRRTIRKIRVGQRGTHFCPSCQNRSKS